MGTEDRQGHEKGVWVGVGKLDAEVCNDLGLDYMTLTQQNMMKGSCRIELKCTVDTGDNKVI